ncbi:MAG TPA: carboxypeptidase regulatory-like domain-containing protein [Thermoanaerobaculia bacterium]|nr:carboxypeptidase regulatory-like domain-containing protein [Thermoanaerobaculia bacterium]
MTRKTERLNRLVIHSPCAESWQAMSGAGSDIGARFCPRCHKHVHDLAAMEAREVAALVAATRGRFCARITRDRAGRLVTRPPAQAPARLAAPPRRASPVAAAVVGAMVGLTGTAWAEAAARAEPDAPAQAPAAPAAASPGVLPQAPPEPARLAKDGTAGAVLAGEGLNEGGYPLPGATIVLRDAEHRERTLVTGADGTFTFESLPAGAYTVAASVEGFELPAARHLVLQPGGRLQVALTGQSVFDNVVTGEVVVEALLRPSYWKSDLVVVATVGPSLPRVEPDPEDSWTDVRTELQVTTILRGTLRGSTVRIDRTEYHGDENNLQIGDTVLALLTPAEDEPTDPVGAEGPGRATHVSVEPYSRLRRLSADALRAYRRQIQALARLGEAPRAGELLEWLVATAEDEHTRQETVRELKGAVEALHGLAGEWADRRRAQPVVAETEALDAEAEADRLLAQAEATGDEAAPTVLGALLTPEHRERLSKALLATERLTAADMELYDLVRPWAGEAAPRWLAERLADDPAPDWAARQAMVRLAGELQDDGLQQLVEQADREIEAVYEEPERESETDSAWDARIASQTEAIQEKLRRNFLRALGGRP